MIIETNQQAAQATNREFALGRIISAIEEFTSIVGNGDSLEDLRNALIDVSSDAKHTKKELTTALDEWMEEANYGRAAA